MVTWSVFVSVTVALFIAVVGAYVYVHKVSGDIRKETSESLDRYLKKIDETRKAVQALELSIVERLVRIETLINVNGGRVKEV